jgi:hypothetical protein
VTRRRVVRLILIGLLSLVFVDVPLLAFLSVERSKFLPPPKGLTAAETRERHEAIGLCQARSIGLDTIQDTSEYFHELEAMRDCMRSLGFHVRIVDQPGKRSFDVEFENLTDK